MSALDATAALRHLRAADPTLGRLVDAVGPFALRVERTATMFGALAEAIVYQQLTAKAAGTIFGRVRSLAPRGRLTPAAVLAVPDTALRGAGLSGAKLLALRDLAARTLAGELPTLRQAERMEDEALIERLDAVRGIGRWTAQMLLIFRLGRPDVLPVDDYGVRKGFARAYRKRALPTPAQLERHGARWAPYRTVASWYLWRALELPGTE